MAHENPFGALAGLKVVDLSRVLGGPYCTQLLADHGADVIKVEPPQGDEVRDWGPPFHDGDASYFIGVNRNKRSIGLDLAQPEGRSILLRLLEDADVLLENFKTGTLERWGLGYEEVLAARFPRLVHARISGFGADGPLGGFPGYDAIVQAMTGMFSVNGEPESGPTRLGIAIVDMGTGLFTATAILMAIIERQRSGRGQFLDMTLYDSAIALMHPHVSNYLLSDRVPGLTGSAHPNISPYDKFRTRTGDVFIGAGNNRAFRRLCALLDAPQLADDVRFRDNSDRVLNRDVLKAELERCMRDCDGEALCRRLLAAGLAAGPVLTTDTVMNHPHTHHRNMVASVGWYRSAGIPAKLSRTPGEVRTAPPPFGHHGREVLREHGYDDDAIDQLVAAGVVVQRRRR